MKTLPQLLDQHKITTVADRLEFEEIVNEVTRQHGAELQDAQLKHDASVAAIYEQANQQIAALEAEHATLTTELAALKEKTAGAIKAASDAIADSDLDDAATVRVVAHVISDLTKDEREKKRETLEASIAAQQEELAKLA